MKKLLSLALVAIMLFSTVAMAIPTSALANASDIDYVEAKYFDVKPYIDGYVTEAEWGTPTVHATQSDASTKSDKDPDYLFFGTNQYPGKVVKYDESTLKMEWYMWIRWDENYYYIATKVYDPDGHSLKNGKTNTWNGDAFQTRIDPLGANAIVEGEDFDAANDSTDHKPWGDQRVCDLVFGYCEMAGGFPEAYENTSGKGMTTLSANPLGVCDPAIVPAGMNYSTDSANGITTYEIAVPWAFVDGWYTDAANHQYKKYSSKAKKDSGPDGLIGVEYGVSAVVENTDGNSGGNMWTAFLTWGSGICALQQTDAVKTCAGSNSVVFSADKVSEDSKYTGNYQKYTLGGPVFEEQPANYATTIDESTHVGPLTYDSDADLEIFGVAQHGERVKDTDGNWVLRWDKDTGDTEYSPTVDGYSVYNYLTTEGFEIGDERYKAKNCSFTFECDIKVTELHTFEAQYATEIYNWFGGSSMVDYQCGYSFEDGVFFIKDFEKQINILQKSADFALNQWHHWVFQYDNDTCVARFYFDPPMNNGRIVDGTQPTLSLKYRYFDYGGLEDCILIFRRMNAQIMFDNLEFYNFVDYSHITEHEHTEGNVPTQPVEKEYDVETSVEKLEDGSFAISVPVMDEFKAADVTALKFVATIADTSKLSFVKVDGLKDEDYTAEDDGNGKVVITIKNLDVLKDLNAGDTLFKVVVKPADGVELTTDEVKELVPIKADVTTLSSNTGDSVVIIAAVAAVVLALGTGIVVVTRRKKNEIEF